MVLFLRQETGPTLWSFLSSQKIRMADFFHLNSWALTNLVSYLRICFNIENYKMRNKRINFYRLLRAAFHAVPTFSRLISSFSYQILLSFASTSSKFYIYYMITQKISQSQVTLPYTRDIIRNAIPFKKTKSNSQTICHLL